MFSEDLVMEEITTEWGALVWGAERGVVKASKMELVRHFYHLDRKRVANALRCGCKLCLNAVSHLVQKQ
jgi:hypothetical protein